MLYFCSSLLVMDMVLVGMVWAVLAQRVVRGEEEAAVKVIMVQHTSLTTT